MKCKCSTAVVAVVVMVVVSNSLHHKAKQLRKVAMAVVKANNRAVTPNLPHKRNLPSKVVTASPHHNKPVAMANLLRSSPRHSSRLQRHNRWRQTQISMMTFLFEDYLLK